jgi:hypothetical protein
MLRAEGDIACVAQMARARIKGRRWPSPSQRVGNLWVVRTLEMHRGRRLTCKTRSSTTAEVKKRPFDAQCALFSAPGQKPRQGKSSFFSLIVAVEREGPKNLNHTSGPLMA